MSYEATIADQLTNVRAQISAAEQKFYRKAGAVTLLAVSKTKPNEAIVAAHNAGQRHFGENYVQEGVDKIQTLTHLSDVTWHFIGPLQSNKTRAVAEHFDWMHTIDRAKIARRLNEQRPDHLPPLQVLVQINIDDESSKSGISPQTDTATLVSLLRDIQALPKLRLRGLMAIPRAIPGTSTEPEQQHESLKRLQDLFSEMQQLFPELDTLSVGMTNDLEVAIAHGSTMVRVGTAIFGARDYIEKD
ncbi:MAG: YggS family pyridoxal phosphate-dependent enzyme [Idiomarina sp.]|nr:YggS family pyridoxal phosphate-dependent enzyme [Idiomarina sp.]